MTQHPPAPWFDALVAPLRDRLEAAWRRLPAPVAGTARSPRAGLGGALVVHVARGWGTRRWQEAGRVAVVLVEAYDQQVFRGAPDPATRAFWLTTDLRRGHHAIREAARRDEALLRRVTARMVGAPDLGEAPVPEAVVFLRGAVAAGVIAGAVPDAVHAALDRWATAVGEAMDGIERGVDITPWLHDAAAALAGLPDCDARDRLAAALDPGPAPLGARPTVSGWVPFHLPEPPPPETALERAIVAPFPGDGPLPTAARWLAARGGKRLRARIALAAARAVRAPPADTADTADTPDEALRVAVVAEWAHTASLVLDDIVDEADLRRGAPALHRATSVPFATGVAGWVLTRTLLHAPDPAAIADTLLVLADGQRDELARAGDLAMDLDAWYTIAAAKTARLFSFAAVGGGASAGADRAQRKALARYGQELGLAFQIVDDVLDYVGEEAALGKRPGQDQRTGRITFPLLLLREADPAALAGPPEGVLAALHHHGIPARCHARAAAHHARAVAALAALPGDTSGLLALASRCVERRA